MGKENNKILSIPKKLAAPKKPKAIRKVHLCATVRLYYLLYWYWDAVQPRAP